MIVLYTHYIWNLEAEGKQEAGVGYKPTPSDILPPRDSITFLNSAIKYGPNVQTYETKRDISYSSYNTRYILTLCTYRKHYCLHCANVGNFIF